MGKYLLIESRDPFDSSDSEYFCELAEGLSRGGNEVVLFLVQNGVLPTRKGAKYNSALSNLIQRKVKIVADRFSLKERALSALLEGVETAEADRLLDLLLEPGTKTIWH